MTNQQVVSRLTKSGASVHLRLSRCVSGERASSVAVLLPLLTLAGSFFCCFRREPVFLQYLAQNGIQSQVNMSEVGDHSSKFSALRHGLDEDEEDRHVRFGEPEKKAWNNAQIMSICRH
jgi:hypothetical protein